MSTENSMGKKSIILPGQKVQGWPKKKSIKQLPTDSLVNILDTKWKQDTHFVQYAVIDEIGAYRYNNEIFASPEYEDYKRQGGSIEIIAIAFDVDSPAKKSQEPGALDIWYEAEREKIFRLQRAFPGGMVWRTKGGWRGCWYCKRRIVTADDTALWRQDYLAAVVFLEREFSIIADSACNDWNRLHRVPFGIRDTETNFGWGEPETRETIGRLEEGKEFAISEISTEADRKESRRRNLPQFQTPAKKKAKREGVATADVGSEGYILKGQSVWERFLRSRNAIIRELGPGKWAIVCPNESQHTSKNNDTSTVLYAPGPGEILGHPHCSHAHCQGLDWRAAWGIFDADWAALTREVVSELPKVPEARGVAGDESEEEKTQEELDDEVIAKLIPDRTGSPGATGYNVAVLLTHHSFWKGRLAYDEFKNERVWIQIPEELAHHHKGEAGKVLSVDSLGIAAWLHKGDFGRRPRIFALPDAIRQGIEAACYANRIDSLKEYIYRTLGGKWDGSSRISSWLIDYMGAENNRLNKVIGERWLIAAIARALNPGCVADMMLILEGPQEAGKNHMLEIMFDKYLVKAPWGLKFGSKDFDQKCAEAWCVHDDELSCLKQTGIGFTKSWLTDREATFRKAYETDFITIERRFVVAGSTNVYKYLDDDENRRFWPVRITKLNANKLKKDRIQLWAEALFYFEQGEYWNIDKTDDVWHELHAVHEDKKQSNPYETKIQELITQGRLQFPCHIHNILEAIGFRSESWDNNSLQQRVGAALRHIGLISRRQKIDGRPKNMWEWPSN